MKQRFFVDNLVYQSSITAESVNAQFPLENLKDDRRTKVFRSTEGKAWVKFDFGFQREIDSILLVDSGIRAFGFTKAKVEFSNIDSWYPWNEPQFVTDVTIDFQHGFAHVFLPSVQRFRYARIVMENTAGYCELSKVFIGSSISMGNLTFTYPVNYRQNNNASVQRNRLGQRFIDEVNTLKEIEGSFNTLSKDELDPFLEMIDFASFTRPIWMYLADGAMTNNNMRLCGYYYLKDDPQMTLNPGNYWNVTVTLEEGA